MDTYICQCTYKHGRFYKTGVLELNPRINGVETLTDWGVNIYLEKAPIIGGETVRQQIDNSDLETFRRSRQCGVVGKLAPCCQELLRCPSAARSPEVPDRLPLLLVGVPCQGSRHLLHLSGGNLVPATKGLHRQGDKGDTLPSAVLRGTIDFPLEGKLESIPRIGPFSV